MCSMSRVGRWIGEMALGVVVVVEGEGSLVRRLRGHSRVSRDPSSGMPWLGRVVGTAATQG